jgi:transposase-like protein
MEKILVIGDRTKRSNDGRSSGLTEEIELRVRRERHRRWRPEEKLRIVQETLRPGEVIAAAPVTPRHGTRSFRRIAAGDSDANQPVNPTEASHRFRGIPATPE